MKSNRRGTFLERGFSFLNWLAVLALLFLVAYFSQSGLIICGQPAERNRTTTIHAALQAGLARYEEMHGEYPTPAHPDATVKISGKDMRVGSARMLYQMVTGDGDNEINRASATGNASDGKISEEESKNVINGSVPKSMVVKDKDGYYLVDGWGRPFQYTKGGAEDALNPTTYDLWSFGSPDSKGPFFRVPAPAPFYDVESRRNVEATAMWIKNW